MIQKMRASAVLLAMVTVSAASGQARTGTGPGARILPPGGTLGPAVALASAEVVRELDDPHNGDRWLLMRDPDHPRGPGRLMLAARTFNKARLSEPGTVPPRPVIHAGDRLIVEENTAVAEARLEAIALGSATVGAPLDVRLKIGGKVVRAVALAMGRAAFQQETGVRP